MIVTVERTGGLFAAAPARARLAADALEAEERERLERLAALIRERPACGDAHPDAYRFQVTVEEDGEGRCAIIDEGDAPPELRELLHWALLRGAPEPP
jgi:hypothetical protein